MSGERCFKPFAAGAETGFHFLSQRFDTLGRLFGARNADVLESAY